jgi:hypothetical protein
MFFFFSRKAPEGKRFCIKFQAVCPPGAGSKIDTKNPAIDYTNTVKFTHAAGDPPPLTAIFANTGNKTILFGEDNGRRIGAVVDPPRSDEEKARTKKLESTKANPMAGDSRG